MNILRRSWGKFCRLSVSLVVASLMGCASSFQASDIKKKPAVAPDLTPPSIQQKTQIDETSLIEDQSQIEALRQNIPVEKRTENNDLKEILSYMGEIKDPPQRIREKFNRILWRVREKHRIEVQRIRENFNKEEKSYRDQFYTSLKKEREEFLKSRVSHPDRKKFFDEQDTKRREFTADERDRRHQFTADLKMKVDDFNQTLREKINEFNQEYRVYSQKYDVQIKSLKEKNERAKHPPAGIDSPLEAGEASHK